MPNLPSSPKRDFYAWLSILAGCLLVYAPAFHGAFLWDDDGHVTKQSLRSLHGLWRIWTNLGATQQYYPVLHTAFWLEWFLWGESLLGYHLTNILLHATAACMVVAIVRQLKLPGAWFAGLLFALHPVCVESVAWISEQKNTLSTVLVLGAVLLFLKFHENRRPRYYGFAFLLFILALLTKSVTAMVPAALIVVLWWKQGRLAWRNDVLPLGLWLVIGAAAGLFTAWVEHTYIGAQGADFSLTTGQRILLSGRIPLFYLSKLVLPTNLAFIYPRWAPDASVAFQWLFPLALIVILLALWLLRQRSRGPLAALLCYLTLLFPVLGFVNVYPFIFSFVADHFQYLASIALIVPFSASATAAARNQIGESRRWVSVALPTIPLLVLGTITWKQSQIYCSCESLYQHTLALNPACWMAHNNLASAISADPQRYPEAIEYYRKAIALKPNYPEAHFNAANILAKNPATVTEAIGHYEAALLARPLYAEAHNNYGSLLARLPDRLPDAVAHFQEAIRQSPEFVEAYNNLATSLARMPNRLTDAIACYRSAIRLEPGFAESHFNLGNVLAKSPATRIDAIAEYKEALRLRPDYAEAHVNLGFLLSQDSARRTDAIAQYEAALKLRPDFENVRRALEHLQQSQP